MQIIAHSTRGIRHLKTIGSRRDIIIIIIILKIQTPHTNTHTLTVTRTDAIIGWYSPARWRVSCTAAAHGPLNSGRKEQRVENAPETSTQTRTNATRTRVTTRPSVDKTAAAICGDPPRCRHGPFVCSPSSDCAFLIICRRAAGAIDSALIYRKTPFSPRHGVPAICFRALRRVCVYTVCVPESSAKRRSGDAHGLCVFTIHRTRRVLVLFVLGPFEWHGNARWRWFDRRHRRSTANMRGEFTLERSFTKLLGPYVSCFAWMKVLVYGGIDICDGNCGKIIILCCITISVDAKDLYTKRPQFQIEILLPLNIMHYAIFARGYARLTLK